MLQPVVPRPSRPTVTVVIPARNEEPTIARIVAALVEAADIDEVLVVDDGSTDDTAAAARHAGARVSAAPHGPGKGAAMWHGVAEAEGDIVAFCDADLENFDASFVTTLVGALRDGGDHLVLVKADYERAGAGGRVTELAARPILRLLHPALAHLAQPLSGEYVAWREALEQVPFVTGYGVELGLLLDLADRYGIEAIDEVHVGIRRHRNRPLRELGVQAEEVLAVALDRAGLSPVGGITIEELPPMLARERRSA